MQGDVGISQFTLVWHKIGSESRNQSKSMLVAYKGEYMQITVIRKSDNSVITRIFEDEEGIKEITDDDYEVLIEKDSN